MVYQLGRLTLQVYWDIFYLLPQHEFDSISSLCKTVKHGFSLMAYINCDQGGWWHLPYHVAYILHSFCKNTLPVSLMVWYFLVTGLLQFISPISLINSVPRQLDHTPQPGRIPALNLQCDSQQNFTLQCHGLPTNSIFAVRKTLFSPSMLMEVKQFSLKSMTFSDGQMTFSNTISMIKFLLKFTDFNFVIGKKHRG